MSLKYLFTDKIEPKESLFLGKDIQNYNKNNSFQIEDLLGINNEENKINIKQTNLNFINSSDDNIIYSHSKGNISFSDRVTVAPIDSSNGFYFKVLQYFPQNKEYFNFYIKNDSFLNKNNFITAQDIKDSLDFITECRGLFSYYGTDLEFEILDAEEINTANEFGAEILLKTKIKKINFLNYFNNQIRPTYIVIYTNQSSFINHNISIGNSNILGNYNINIFNNNSNPIIGSRIFNVGTSSIKGDNIFSFGDSNLIISKNSINFGLNNLILNCSTNNNYWIKPKKYYTLEDDEYYFNAIDISNTYPNLHPGDYLWLLPLNQSNNQVLNDFGFIEMQIKTIENSSNSGYYKITFKDYILHVVDDYGELVLNYLVRPPYYGSTISSTFGEKNTNSGRDSFVSGKSNFNIGNFSTILGTSNTNNNHNNILIGQNLTTNYNTENILLLGRNFNFLSTNFQNKPILIVGNGVAADDSSLSLSINEKNDVVVEEDLYIGGEQYNYHENYTDTFFGKGNLLLTPQFNQKDHFLALSSEGAVTDVFQIISKEKIPNEPTRFKFVVTIHPRFNCYLYGFETCLKENAEFIALNDNNYTNQDRRMRMKIDNVIIETINNRKQATIEVTWLSGYSYLLGFNNANTCIFSEDPQFGIVNSRNIELDNDIKTHLGQGENNLIIGQNHFIHGNHNILLGLSSFSSANHNSNSSYNFIHGQQNHCHSSYNSIIGFRNFSASTNSIIKVIDWQPEENINNKIKIQHIPLINSQLTQIRPIIFVPVSRTPILKYNFNNCIYNKIINLERVENNNNIYIATLTNNIPTNPENYEIFDIKDHVLEYSFIHGKYNLNTHYYAFTSGEYLITARDYAATFGSYNLPEKDNIFTVGNGTTEKRSNAFSIKENGDTYINGNLELSNEKYLNSFYSKGNLNLTKYATHNIKNISLANQTNLYLFNISNSYGGSNLTTDSEGKQIINFYIENDIDNSSLLKYNDFIVGSYIYGLNLNNYDQFKFEILSAEEVTSHPNVIHLQVKPEKESESYIQQYIPKIFVYFDQENLNLTSENNNNILLSNNNITTSYNNIINGSDNLVKQTNNYVAGIYNTVKSIRNIINGSYNILNSSAGIIIGNYNFNSVLSNQIIYPIENYFKTNEEITENYFDSFEITAQTATKSNIQINKNIILIPFPDKNEVYNLYGFDPTLDIIENKVISIENLENGNKKIILAKPILIMSNSSGDLISSYSFFLKRVGISYNNILGKNNLILGSDNFIVGEENYCLGKNNIILANDAVATTNYQTILGIFNKPESDNYALLFGIGTAANERKNGFTLDWDGNAIFAGTVKSGTTELLKNDLSNVDQGSFKTKVIEVAPNTRTCRFVIGTSTSGWTSADCDYLCDGINDNLEIQAAIDDLPTTGGEITILDGIYNLSVLISVNKENIVLKGNSASGTILNCISSNGLSISKNYIEIKNLTIKNSNTYELGYPSSGYGIRTGINTHHLKIENIFINNYYVGIDLAYQNEVINSEISHCVNGIETRSSNNFILNNRFLDCVHSINFNGGIIKNNIINNMTDLGDYYSNSTGIKIKRGNAIVSENILYNDYIQYGIEISNSDESSDILISHNILNRALEYTDAISVLLLGNARRVRLLYNTMIGCNYANNSTATTNEFIGNKYE